MGLSNRNAEDFLNYFYRANSGTVVAPTTLWLALHAGDPTVSNEIQPIGTNGYSRVQVSAPATFFTAPSGTPRQISNNSVVTFPVVATANWGTVSGFAIWKSSSSLLAADLMWGGSATTRVMNVGDTYRLEIGGIVLKAG